MGLVKPVVVAGVWAVGSTILPLVEAQGGMGLEGVLLAGYRSLFILPNVLLADWGDRAGDVQVGLRPWTRWGTEWGLRSTATGFLLVAVGGASIGGLGSSLLWFVDGVGPLLMLIAVWTVQPDRPAHRFLLDLVVAWPLVTALAAWSGLG